MVGTSLLQQAAEAANESSDSISENLIAVLAFGVAALLVMSIIYKIVDKLSVTFARMYGLIVVAILAVGLAFTELGDTETTTAFTLLGAIAGYLAGATPQTVQTGGPAAPEPAEPAAGVTMETVL